MTSFYCMSVMCLGFPGGSVVKNWPANAGDTGSIPGPGRSPGEGNGNPLRYSCLGNPMDRGAWWAAVYGIAQRRTRLKRLSSSSSRELRSHMPYGAAKKFKKKPSFRVIKQLAQGQSQEVAEVGSKPLSCQTQRALLKSHLEPVLD